MIFPQRIVITNVHDGLGHNSLDDIYIRPFYKKMGNVVYKYEDKDEMYLTDFFNPEFIDDYNDYIHYGFLIVSYKNFEFMDK